MLKTKNYIFYLLLFWVGHAMAQAPEQDCTGSIAVCQNSYTQQNSYSGEGNNSLEINPAFSCLSGGELNSVWYTMTIQEDGFFNFSITPNVASDDYDWAVFNLTNAGCADIATNPALEVSCNFSGNTGNGGITGANGNTTGTGGAQNEAEIPVHAGETYVISVSNFSSTQSGYSLDMSQSSAVVFDDVAPTISSVEQPILCGTTQFTFNFTENVLCSEVDASKFKLDGPGGPYAITLITGANCQTGNSFEKTFVANFSPATAAGGTYNLILVAAVEDLCNNPSNIPDTFSFEIIAIDLSTQTIPDTCNLGLGSATIITPPGTGPYNYQWLPTGGNAATATNLTAGTYTVVVSDQAGGCSQQANITIGNTPPPTAAFTVKPEHLSYLDPTGHFTDNSNGATQWQWNFGDGSPTVTEENPVHTFPGPGQYLVELIVSNDVGCTDTLEYEVSVTFLTTVYIPNAFTPAYGNGLNNTWGPIGEGISEEGYSLSIFNKWGQLVFQSSKLEDQWDGRFNDTDRQVEQGVYVYKLNLTDLNGEERQYTGGVTVLWK